MNYQILFVLLTSVHLLYSLLCSLLSIKSIRKPIPECICDIYNAEDYVKYQHYQKDRDLFDIVHAACGFVLSLLLYLSPVFPTLSASIENPFLCALAVLGVYVVFTLLTETPFDYYSTYVIEEKYGFNKTNKKTFAADTVKNALINFLLFYGLTALYIWLYGAMKLWAIPLVSAVLLLFILIFNFLAPVLVRIDNKKTPLEEGELRTKLTTLLTSEGYQVKDIYVIDGSKRSSKANAFFTGVGKLKSIMLYDTLVDLMTPDEICAVFAHELGHGKHKDAPKNILLSFLNLALIMTFLILFTYFEATTSFLNIPANCYGFLFLLYMEAFLPIYSTIFGILSNGCSRSAEYRADRMARDKGYGDALVSALKKLGLNNYANLTPNKFLVFMTYSHPTLEQRINAIRK